MIVGLKIIGGAGGLAPGMLIGGGRFGSNFCPGGNSPLRFGIGPVSKVLSKLAASAPRGSEESGGAFPQIKLFLSPGFTAIPLS